MVSFSLRPEVLTALKALAEKEYSGNKSYALEVLVAQACGLPKPEVMQRHKFPKGANFGEQVKVAYLKRREAMDARIKDWQALPFEQQVARLKLMEDRDLLIELLKQKLLPEEVQQALRSQ